MNSVVYLKPGKEESLLRRHPWVFSGAISHAEGKITEGDIVQVFSSHGQFLGCGHVADGSIAVRIISFEKLEIDDHFWLNKLQKAYNLRKDSGITDDPSTNMYRLVHGEGDGLPGLIIDIYAYTAVIQAHSLGMHLNIASIARALMEIFGNKLLRIYDKSSETLSKIKGVESVNGYLNGDGDGHEICLENNCKFNIDYINGQKTGFFIDQRDNRKLLGQYSEGKKILNVFSYTGGFSIYALKNRALEVHSLDSSAKALELTDENVRSGGIDPSKHRSIKADALEYLKSMDQIYDIIVLDPPAFAKRIDARHAAVQAYKRINVQAMKQLKPGGMLFTFSCSQAVDAELFRHTLTAAAIEARRDVKILHKMRQPSDHPVSIFHPEGEYLKGLVLKVD